MILTLCSGEGRTFEAVTRVLGEKVTGMLTNVESAPVRAKARALGVPECCIPHKQFTSREAHEAALLAHMKNSEPVQILALLGYMRILSPQFLDRFKEAFPDSKVINLHPAPLSQYKGPQGLQFALRSRAPRWGISVHEVTPELDAGPILAYRHLDVFPTDTFHHVRDRAHPLEVNAVLEAIDILTRRQPT
jgi:phosphoribosylglycinamide formyltransferase-1